MEFNVAGYKSQYRRCQLQQSLRHSFGFLIALMLVTLVAPARAQTPCGGDGQRACCLGERAQGACNPGLQEVAGCQGDCRCRGSIFSSSGTCRAPWQPTPCGGEGQRACCVGERPQGACDPHLYEREGAPPGDNRCKGGVASSSGTCVRPTPCGGDGQRACCLGERAEGACNPGLQEVAGCQGDCRCRASIISSSGTCRVPWQPTPCGGEGQRACCVGERSQGACDANLYERAGAPPGDNRCKGGVASSSGTCVRLTPCGGAGQRACCLGEAPFGACLSPFYERAPAPAGQDNTCRGGAARSSGTCHAPTPCGGVGQRACCLGERAAGPCDADLWERAGAPAGNNTCAGGLASSSGTCVRYTPCGGAGQRACCVGERVGGPCDGNLIEEAGGVPPDARCRNNLLFSSSHCRVPNPRFVEHASRDCVRVGYREWNARFVDGDLATCERTPANVAGMHFDRPSRCQQPAFASIDGQFDVPDPGCRASFGEATSIRCSGGIRTYRARLNAFRLDDYPAVCRNTRTTIDVERTPNRCEQTPDGTFGEFDVEVQACPDEPTGGKEKGDCPANVVSVSEVVTRNDKERVLAVWTFDMTAAEMATAAGGPEVRPRMHRHLQPGERHTIESKDLPPNGHRFQLVVLDVTAVLAENKRRLEHNSSLGLYGVDSVEDDGAIYNAAFYASFPVELISCKDSGVGYSHESGSFYVRGPGRELPPSTPPTVLGPDWSVPRPSSAAPPGMPSDAGTRSPVPSDGGRAPADGPSLSNGVTKPSASKHGNGGCNLAQDGAAPLPTLVILALWMASARNRRRRTTHD